MNHPDFNHSPTIVGMGRPRALPTQRRDVRPLALAAVLAGILLIGAVVGQLPGRGTVAGAPPAASPPGFSELRDASPPAPRTERESSAPPTSPERNPTNTAPDKNAEVKSLLKQAVAEINAKRYDAAIATLNRLRPLAPKHPEAYRLVGEALLGKRDFDTSRDFFNAATNLDPMLADAYFGFAIASEGLGDLEAALGGMRSYLHTEKNKDPYRLKVAQARSAIWEWESKLGRGPWGPTKGIPPGFTADEIKRDGKGVGTKMQKAETLRPDGTMDYEIKSGDRFPELWKK